MMALLGPWRGRLPGGAIRARVATVLPSAGPVPPISVPSPSAPRPPIPGASLASAVQYASAEPRSNWTRAEIAAIYKQPFTELLFQAAAVHRANFDPLEVQKCTLLSIKTGGCSEDCKYCSQSSKYVTDVKATPTMQLDEVVEAAKRAKEAGSTRFCMGTAWRELGAKKSTFKRILSMVKEVRGMGLEVCCTLGMVNEEQARQLKEAGLSAYNHNLDTSREHYPNVITTRTYDDRLETIRNVRKAGITVCCGGILGIGEGVDDRIGLLHELASMEQHPESVPVNSLVAIDGTPLEGTSPVSIFEIGRTIATARIVMPKSVVRLSAGRLSFSEMDQAVMFMAGANSIFTGDKLLTTPNPEANEDAQLFDKLGLKGRPAFAPGRHDSASL
jgi:biotin synthase